MKLVILLMVARYVVMNMFMRTDYYDEREFHKEKYIMLHGILWLQIKVQSESLGEKKLNCISECSGHGDLFRVSSLAPSSKLARFLGQRERFRKRIKTQTQQEKYGRQQNFPGLGQFGHWECCQSVRYFVTM